MRIGWLRRLFGDRGERLATKFLRNLGFTILATQDRSLLGEIDIVVQKGDTIVFVEVKTRKSTAAGHPTEAITLTKQKQLTRTALAWLKRRNLLEHRARFDVIAIIWGDGKEPIIQHYINAFEPTGDGQMYS
ncbi:MAG: YraN family protein [Planctomycetaceae bacterium]